MLGRAGRCQENALSAGLYNGLLPVIDRGVPDRKRLRLYPAHKQELVEIRDTVTVTQVAVVDSLVNTCVFMHLGARFLVRTHLSQPATVCCTPRTKPLGPQR